MNIERIREYAKESGLPGKRIEDLMKLLHPDENGELDTREAMDAMAAVNYAVRARETTRAAVEAVRADRARREKQR